MARNDGDSVDDPTIGGMSNGILLFQAAHAACLMSIDSTSSYVFT